MTTVNNLAEVQNMLRLESEARTLPQTGADHSLLEIGGNHEASADEKGNGEEAEYPK